MEIRNQLVQCPYDPCHVVKLGRIQQHLVKCRKNHLDEEFIMCPFNACHRLLPAEIKRHLASCPDRECLEKEIYLRKLEESGKSQSGNLSVPVFNTEPPPCTEDWDEDDDISECNGCTETDDDQPFLDESCPRLPSPPTVSRVVTPTVQPNESPPVLQPRVTHTAMVQSEKRNHTREGLRLPKNLPKALEHKLKHGILCMATEKPTQQTETDPAVLEVNTVFQPPETTTTQGTTSGGSPLGDDLSDSPAPRASQLNTAYLTSTDKNESLSYMSPVNNAVSSETKPQEDGEQAKCLSATASRVKPESLSARISSLPSTSPKLPSLGRGMLFTYQMNSRPLKLGRQNSATWDTTTWDTPSRDMPTRDTSTQGKEDRSPHTSNDHTEHSTEFDIVGTRTGQNTCSVLPDKQRQEEKTSRGQDVTDHSSTCSTYHTCTGGTHTDNNSTLGTDTHCTSTGTDADYSNTRVTDMHCTCTSGTDIDQSDTDWTDTPCTCTSGTDTDQSSDTERDEVLRRLLRVLGRGSILEQPPDPLPPGKGRGLLALSYLKNRKKDQEPAVGNHVANSPVFHMPPSSKGGDSPGIRIPVNPTFIVPKVDALNPTL